MRRQHFRLGGPRLRPLNGPSAVGRARAAPRAGLNLLGLRRVPEPARPDERGEHMEMQRHDANGPHAHDAWVQWPVYWSAVWVGALAALATALVCGLIGLA